MNEEEVAKICKEAVTGKSSSKICLEKIKIM
jgi:hypothetical protein